MATHSFPTKIKSCDGSKLNETSRQAGRKAAAHTKLSWSCRKKEDSGNSCTTDLSLKKKRGAAYPER